MFKNFRFLTSGESHGKCLTGIIEGMPSGFEICPEKINKDLGRRQSGFGRGDRMKIELDEVEIKSGVRFGKTTGAPICLEIKNKDYVNWKKVMSVLKSDKNSSKSFTIPRAGHADFAGKIKYDLKDLRDVLERASARKTAMNVAIGSVAKQFLNEFSIEIESRILSIHGKKTNTKEEIEKAKLDGESLGGSFEVVVKNVPIGLGSCVQWDRKLDGLLAQAIISIPAVKAVEFGLGQNYEKYRGSEVCDEISFVNGRYVRKSNNAGGIEGGMSNGENIVIRAVMKPVPTIKKEVKSVDMEDNTNTTSFYERSDTCAVEACSVIAEAMVACVITDEFLDKFGRDNYTEIRKNYENREV